MGMRLHYAVHYNPEWEGGYFNRDIDAWKRLYNAKFEENGWAIPDASQYQVARQDVENYIETIKSSPETKNEYFTEYTNLQIQEILEEILLSVDDDIRIEWF